MVTEQLLMDQPARSHDNELLLSARDLSIHFGPIVANQDVNLDLFAAEVHCVLGENGAGKSTLMKMLYGVYQPDSGSIAYQGAPVRVSSPHVARELGIGMVFQDFRLVPALTVFENVALAFPASGPRLRRREITERLREVSAMLGLKVDFDARVRTLPIAQRQQVEIAKVLVAGARVVILDEPTSVLAPQEVDGLFAQLDEMRRKGLSIVMITHKVKEARQVGDRLTVLRGGKTMIEGVAPTTVDDETLVIAMVGREVPPLPSERERASTSTVALAVRGLVVPGDAGRSGIADLDLEVLAGEVMGIAGVAGSGQLELADALAGIGTVKSGSIRVGGRVVKSVEPRDVLDAGIVSVPEDPVSQWVVCGLNVVEHVALSLVRKWTDRGKHRRRFGIDWGEVRATVNRLDEKAALRMAAPHRQVATLSGGNIQRVLLTQTLGAEAAVYVLAYPNRGLDVASARQVHELIMLRRAAGAAVILISEDLDELISVCDRIAVLHNGRLSGVRNAHATDRTELGHLMLVEVA